jgi:hypothetical protein
MDLKMLRKIGLLADILHEVENSISQVFPIVGSQDNTTGDPVTELSYHKNRGQVIALHHEKQSACNYCNENQA